jgi:hypothetical protein
MDDLDKLDFPKLPPKENLYSSVRFTGINDKGYAHAINVFSTLRCNKVLDYHVL